MQYGMSGITDLLGVGDTTPVAPIRLATMIEEGLPVASLDSVAQAVAPNDTNFRYRIVPRATLMRRMRQPDGRLSPEESGRLARLAGIWAFALEVWGDDSDAREFLFRKHPLIEMRLPIDVVLGSDVGAGVIEQILGRLKYGTAA
jgi:putative toxin-antitoxin system antitoxin component (TIGR02293 family)